MTKVAFTVVLALAACQPAPETPPTTPQTTVTAAPTDTVLRLERTVCFGFCPTYIVSITAGGAAHLQGTRRAEGFQRDLTLDPAAVSALVERFKADGFFELDTAYVPGHPMCDLYATDHPGAQLFARLGDRTRRVTHYHGCRGPRGARPEQDRAAPLLLLNSLEDAVDSLAGIAAMADSLRGQGGK